MQDSVLPELTGEILIDRINSATSGAVDLARLPVGSDATAVSRGDHHHNMAYYPRADADATFLTQAEGDALYVPLGSPLSPWQATDNDIAYDLGNVGVGDPAPQTALSVQGSATSFQLSGTVSSTGTTTIDGDGTAFSAELVVGESVIIGSQAYTVADIANDTTMTVSPAPAAGFLDEVAYRAGDLLRVADSGGGAMLDVDRQGNVIAAGNLTIGGTVQIRGGGFCASDPADPLVNVCLRATNAAEDSYVSRPLANDTCDGNATAQYTCGVMEARTCIDRYQTTVYLARTVTCRRAYILQSP